MTINQLAKLTYAAMVIATVTFSACTKPVEEQENLTTLKLTVAGKTFVWSDTDGDGGNAPKFDTLKLSPNLAAMDFTVDVFDGSVNPEKHLTHEVIAESTAHLFVFTVSNGATLAVSNVSKDTGGKDFGQSGKMATGAASTGKLQIVLKHEADKSAANPANTGTTDIEAEFSVVIR